MEECIICFEETTEFIFFPCAHKVCASCYKRIDRCPICNTVDLEIQQPIIPQQSSTCSRWCGLFVLGFLSYVAYETIG